MCPDNISFRPFFRWKHSESYFLPQSYPQRFKHFCRVSPANYVGTMAPYLENCKFYQNTTTLMRKKIGEMSTSQMSFSGDAPNCSFDFQIFTWSFKHLQRQDLSLAIVPIHQQQVLPLTIPTCHFAACCIITWKRFSSSEMEDFGKDCLLGSTTVSLWGHHVSVVMQFARN